MYAISKAVGIFTVPPSLLALIYNYYSKRKSAGWRQDLCDTELRPYKDIPVEENRFVRYSGANDGPQRAIPLANNPGLRVNDAFLSLDELTVLSRFAKELVGELGLPIPYEGKTQFAKFLHRAGFPAQPAPNSGYDEALLAAAPESATDVALTELNEAELVKKYSAFLDSTRYVSDHPEDEHPERPKWGCGDSLRVSKLPLPLRALSHKVKERLPHLGHLRHVYVEYSPGGEFIRMPKPMRGFDGHEFVIIPFMGEDGAVISFTPVKRDTEPDARRVMQRGWTSADIDVFVPGGGMLQVYSRGRFKYGWGVRPGQPWFGHPRNVLPLGEDLTSLKPRPDSEIVQGAAAAASASSSAVSRPWWSWLWPFGSTAAATTQSASDGETRADLLGGFDATVATSSLNNNRPLYSCKWWGPPPIPAALRKLNPAGAAALAESKSATARGVLVLCYEGPVSEKKNRNRRVMWEIDAYGVKPTTETVTHWAPDTPPTEEDVKSEGRIMWMLRNYPALIANAQL